MRIVILGGAGVFGGRLSRLLANQSPAHEITIAGRNLARARTFADEIGAQAARIDRDGDLGAAFERWTPDLVIDAAGPFQAYGDDPYRVARAALAAGAHYLDLADDSGFVAGISDLDAQARAAGTVALSGASSVPAISAAAADSLAEGLVEIALIESAIVPGNRAPRGLSVTRAILAQAGRPLRLWRGGRWRTAPAWSGARRIEIAGLGSRRASLIGAPDLALFPERYRARSVLFRAVLELALLHRGLALAAWAPRLGLLRSLAPFARVFRGVAAALSPFGSDRGGMQVRVCGRDGEGRAVERIWSLAAFSGDGPSVPAIPALVLTGKLDELAPGARPCLGAATLVELEAALERLDAHIDRSERPAPRLFEAALGEEAWRVAPEAVRGLHDAWDLDSFAGEASVERGDGRLAGLLAAFFGFPPAASSTPVAVEIRREGDREIWVRQFGSTRFRSTLSPAGPGRLIERFGPIRVALDISVADGALTLSPRRSWLWRAPLPRALTPRGDSFERQDAEGRFRFDVEIGLPLVGRIVRYRGWLRRTQTEE